MAPGASVSIPELARDGVGLDIFLDREGGWPGPFRETRAEQGESGRRGVGTFHNARSYLQ